MKLWNVRYGLGIRSFAVELLTIRALQGKQVSGYDGKVATVFQFLQDHIETLRLVDPANSNNVITDPIEATTKRRIAEQAGAALSADYWSQVLW
jgi:hypothetical protein